MRDLGFPVLLEAVAMACITHHSTRVLDLCAFFSFQQVVGTPVTSVLNHNMSTSVTKPSDDHDFEP